MAKKKKPDAHDPPLEWARDRWAGMEDRAYDKDLIPLEIDHATEINELRMIVGALLDWADSIEAITIVFDGDKETEH